MCRRDSLCLAPHNSVKCGVDNKQQCSRERKISSVTVWVRDQQKNSKCFTAVNIYYSQDSNHPDDLFQSILLGSNHLLNINYVYSYKKLTVETPKPKQLLRPITTGAGSAMNQSQFLAITYNSLEAREKSHVRGFGFDSHWLKNWCKSLSQSLNVAIAIT